MGKNKEGVAAIAGGVSSDIQACQAYIRSNRLSILVKPSAPRTEILGWDEARKALRIAIAAPPDKDKANVELVKFLSRLLSKKVRLVSGRASKKKVVEIIG